MRPQTVMDNNHNNANNKTNTTGATGATDATDEMQRSLLDKDLLKRPYSEQIRLMLTHIIPAAVVGYREAKYRYGVTEVTPFDLCATIAIGIVELRTHLLTGIDIIFCSSFALDMPGVPYVDRALWEIVHLHDFDSIPGTDQLPFTQEQMRLAVAQQISQDMADAGIVEPLTAELLDKQIAVQEQQTRELVKAGDLSSFSMASSIDCAISMIRLRLAGMVGVAVQITKTRLPTFLGDLARQFPNASIKVQNADATDASGSSGSTSNSTVSPASPASPAKPCDFFSKEMQA